MIAGLAVELRADVGSGKLPAALSTGLVIAAIVLVSEAAIASIIFAGPLSPFIPQGTGAILFGTLAMCLITALMGCCWASPSFPHSTARPRTT